jgi:pilus assembly protein Flp/PilA
VYYGLFVRRVLDHFSSNSRKQGEIMLATLKKIRHFIRSEDGPTAVEYAVMLALIIIVCLVAITSVGTQASTTFSNVASSLGGAS